MSVMSLVLAALVVVFGGFRFTSTQTFHAEFTNSSGLKSGEYVKVAGVEVGRVSTVKLLGQERVRVTFEVDDTFKPGTATHATVRYLNLTGDRFLELVDAVGVSTPLPRGGIIPRERTTPALDLDLLLGSFKPLLKSIEPQQVNAFSSELLAIMQGQVTTITSFLAKIASLTKSLAERDVVIGRVITNLNTVVGTMATHRAEFSQAISSTSQLVSALSTDSQTWGEGLMQIDKSTAELASLLIDTRKPLQQNIIQLGRTAQQLNEGSGTIVDLANRLPDAYNALTRLGAYGNFFNYYLCGLKIKFNGLDGKNVTTPLFGQTTGRCAPK